MLRATPPYRIVYLSGIVPLDDRTIALEAQRPANASDVVMGKGLELLGSHFIEYPAGAVVESDDACLISQHYNDQRPVTLRATGLKPIFDEVSRIFRVKPAGVTPAGATPSCPPVFPNAHLSTTINAQRVFRRCR